MNNDKYFNEIESTIKSLEIKKKVRNYQENQDTLISYWSIGKLLVDAQDGEERAKYGKEVIKSWSIELSERYGKGYSYSDLQRYKKFYNLFPIVGSLSPQLTWTHIRYLLPIKNENKRNYYYNLVIKNNLSVRELIAEIKSNSYERLLNKPKHIDIITSNKLSPLDKIKNPIIIKVKNKTKFKNESELEIAILSEITYFLNQLGDDYFLKANQYKVIIDGVIRYIDILLYSLEMNCYVVVELKLNKIDAEAVGQTLSYMNAIDTSLRKYNQNPTLGIIISKENDKFMANFISSNKFNIIPLEYEIKKLINV